MKKVFVLMVFVFSSCYLSFGQPPKQKGERVQAMKIAFFTKKLKLTPAEAQVFWPVYYQFQDENKALRKGMKKGGQDERPNFQELSEAEAKNILDKMIVMKQSEVDLMKTYSQRFQSVLPMQKVPLVFIAEEQFTRHLLKELKSHQGNPQNRGHNPDKRGGQLAPEDRGR